MLIDANSLNVLTGDLLSSSIFLFTFLHVKVLNHCTLLCETAIEITGKAFVTFVYRNLL